LVRNNKQKNLIPHDFSSKLRVFTSSGSLLTEFPWGYDDIVAYGWTYNECIAAITSDGTIYVYNIHGKRMLEAFIDDNDGTDLIQISSAQVTKFGISCAFSSMPGKIAFFSFANNSTTFYRHELPSGSSITAIAQIIPGPTHIADSFYTNTQYSEDDEFLLSELNNPARFKMYPKIAVAATLSSRSNSLFILSPTTITEHPTISSTPITRLFVDSSQKFAALWCEETRIVSCFSLEKRTTLYTFTSQSKRSPQHIFFIGSSALLRPTLDPSLTNRQIRDEVAEPPSPCIYMHWNVAGRSVAMIIDDSGSFRSYNWPCWTMAIQEADYTIRVISETHCDLIQSIHPDIVDTLEKGSKSPATQLLSSYLQFRTNHMQADILLRRLIDSNQLANATQCVLNAACHSLHEPTQSLLLKVCAYGRTYIEPGQDEDTTIAADEFVNVCQIAKLLFNIRQTSLGIPLTYQLLKTYYSQETLILRLMTYRQHAFAIKLCALLKTPPDLVVRDWCLAKLLLDSNSSNSQPTAGTIAVKDMGLFPNTPGNKSGKMSHLSQTQQLVFSIADKLRLCKTRSYVSLTLWAAKYHKLIVGTALAHFEYLSTHQVALFLSLGEFNSALRAAHLSNDYELLIVTIGKIYDILEPKRSFFQLIHSYPDIELTYLNYLSKNQFDLYLEYCTSLSNIPSLSTIRFIAISSQQLHSTTDSPKQLFSNFSQLSKDVQDDKLGIMASGFGQLITEHDMLMQIQHKYITSGQLPDDSLGLSLVETIRALYRSKQEPLVNMLKEVFKIADQRLAYIHIDALIDAEDWSTLGSKSMQFVNVLNGGYQYIIEALVDAKSTQQAIRYIDLLPKTPQQLEWLCSLGLDVEGLKQLKTICGGNQQQQQVIDKLIQEMSR
jgi:hypothetical protein